MLLTILGTPAMTWAEPVLVEFTTASGVSLVADGDGRTNLGSWNEEETRKRVEARATAIAAARALLVSTLSHGLVATITGDYSHFPLLQAEVSAAERRALEAHPQVVAVHDDRQRTLLMESSLAYMGASDCHDSGFVGDGTSVAVLDTGIRYWNGAFGDCPEPGAEGCRVLVFEGFADLEWGTGETDPEYVARASGHGTNVGGIVSAVAPGTGLLSLGVFAWYQFSENYGDVYTNDSDVTEALDWVIDHRDEYNIVAANMSLGGEVDPRSTGYCGGWMGGAYVVAFANTRDAGVLPVVASGNDNVKTAIAPPSCIASAVAVGAGYDDPAIGRECDTGPVIPGAVTCFSNSNALIDLIAPGEHIDAGGLYDYAGTSMAAPHVAGLAALYHARYATSPIWTLERMRADAVSITEIGPQQTYIHRSARIGSHDAELTFDTGVVLESSFDGYSIPDGNDIGLRVAEEVVCNNELCISDVVGKVYLDLSVDHPRVGDLVIELIAPDGAVARYEVGEDELGLENVNSILGSQHLPQIFDELRGSPIEGTWELYLADDTLGRASELYRAVLLIDSARVEIGGALTAPTIARPDEPFEVAVTLENLGNLDVTAADLSLELANVATGDVAQSVPLPIDLPSSPGDVSEYLHSLQAPQGAYEVRVVGDLTPELAPGLIVAPQQVNVTYRTFASFVVDPEVPTTGEAAQLRLESRGIVESQRWDFGDGMTSEDTDPSHAWLETGEYEVRLTVEGPDGVSTTARLVTVRGQAAVPVFNVGGGGCNCRITADTPPRGGGTALLFLGVLLAVSRLRHRRRSSLRLAGKPSVPATILFLGLGVLASNAACWDEPPLSQPDAGEVADSPWCSILAPPDPTIGDIPLYVMLGSETSEPCDLSLEYRVGDTEYQLATITARETGAAIDALASMPLGEEHVVTWQSTSDVLGDALEVQLRVSAACGEAGETLDVETEPFSVLNFLANNPQALLITEISTAELNVPADHNGDYVELLNTTADTLDLDGWRLEVRAAGRAPSAHTLDGIVLESGERLVIAEHEARVPDAFELEEGLPWTVNTGGTVAIVATYERGVDFVRWGGAIAEPPVGVGWTDDPLLPLPQTLTVLARADETDDTDRASDFCIAAPSPGDAGEGCIVRAAPSELLITELDSQSRNDQVEILNTTADTVNLGGWSILWDGEVFGEGAIPLGGVDIGPGERIVLRDGGPTGVLDHGVLFLGANISIDGLVPVALALEDPHGEIIDFVAAGGSRVRWESWDENEPTPMPGPENTLSRRPGDPDTDSAADFCLTEPSPNAPASECLEPLGFELIITEIDTGRPDWVELYNPGSEPVDLRFVYLSYTSANRGGNTGDFRLYSTIDPGEIVVVIERPIETLPDAIELNDREGLDIAPEIDATVSLRDAYGFGIDFVVWGEPPGGPMWPTTWSGLGVDTHEADDEISLVRYPFDAVDTNSRDDWCWAEPSPGAPNAPCE